MRRFDFTVMAFAATACVAIASPRVDACTCDVPFEHLFPLADAVEVARDTVLRCGAACPETATLVDGEGREVAGAWSTLTLDRTSRDGEPTRALRFFKPRDLLAPQTVYVLIDEDGVEHSRFTTGDAIQTDRPMVPDVSQMKVFDAGCSAEGGGCDSVGVNFGMYVYDVFADPTSTEALYVDVDCAASLESGGRGGVIATAKEPTSETSQHIQLGTNSCDLQGLFPAVAGKDYFIRFAALGKNGRMSAWSDVLKVHLPESCDTGVGPIEVTLAGDETPAACASTVGPLDDGPLPGEPVIDPGNDEDETGEDDAGEDAADGCSSTRSTGTPLFGLLFLLAMRGGRRTTRHRHIE